MNLDTTTASVIIAGILALVVIVGFIFYSKSGNAEIKGPFGTGVKFDGKNDSSSNSGIKAKGLKSQEGGISADDATGRGIEIEDANAKQDIILLSRNTNGSDFDPSIPKFSELSAHGLIAGGNITIQQFVGNYASLEQQRDFFMNDIGIVRPNAHFAKAEFEAYTGVWRKLQALRLSGDDLWNGANENNLFRFVESLREVIKLVREDEIFFEEIDRNHLKMVLTEFSNYRIEKERLIDMDEWQMKNRYFIHDVQKQILRNSLHKRQYEDILEEIRKSFRAKLSNQ